MFSPTQPPPPLHTSDQPFIDYTMTHRLPKIISDVLADHDYPPEIVAALTSLRQELTENQLVGPLNTQADDGVDWFEAWQPWQDNRWRDIPWFFAEAFFYRRLLQAAGYYGWPLVSAQTRPPQPGSITLVETWEQIDPFQPRKLAELSDSITWQIVRTALEFSRTDTPNTLHHLLSYGVWGNRADLSYQHVAAGSKVSFAGQDDLLVIDHRAQVVAHLEALKASPAPRAVHLICDNSGPELLMDLVLVDFLLRFDWVDTIGLHLKAFPTFVSDATPVDLYQTFMGLASQPEFLITELAERLQGYGERLHVKSERFWNSHRFFWELTLEITQDLATAQLVIIKGDANYRRLLGDSVAWPNTMALAQAVPDFPAPFVCLRTLKSPAIVGLAEGQAKELDQQDAEWRVNGQRGVVQMGRIAA